MQTISVLFPAILATYCYVLYRWAFTAEDRALFRRMPKAGEAELPVEQPR